MGNYTMHQGKNIYFNEFLSIIEDPSTRTHDTTKLAMELHRRSIVEGVTKKVQLQGLRKNWTAWQNSSGKVFYYNVKTHRTQWDAPIIPGWNKQYTQYTQ